MQRLEGGQNLKKKRTHDSSVKIGDENIIQGDIAIGEGAKVIKPQITVDSSRTYEVDQVDVTLEQTIAPKLINKYGRRKVGIAGILSIVASIITIVSGYKSLIYDSSVSSNFPSFFDWVPSLSKDFGMYIIGIGVILLFIGAYLFKILEYHVSTQCEKCDKEFAYEEVGTPSVRDVETREGIRRTTTRQYKCRFCGHKITRKFHDLIENEPK